MLFERLKGFAVRIMARSIRKNIATRKYNIPTRFSWWLYHLIVKFFIAFRYNPHYVIKDDVRDCKGPCFIIWNHLARIDHVFIEQATYPKRVNIIASYTEFFRRHLHTVFKMGDVLPKKIYTLDLVSMRAIDSIIKKGGCVAFAAEGMHSIYGTNQPIVPGTGKYLKHYGIPVYFLKLRGSYLTQTRVFNEARKGRVDVELSLLFTPEDLARMTQEEINDKINEAFRYDAYAWQKQQKIKWKHKSGMCSRLSDICYRCPKCGAELEMICEPEFVKCSKCGNGFTVNDYYEMIPLDDSCVIPESPSKWVAMEREIVIREIREDPEYSFTARGKLGDLPDNRYLRHFATTELCGEGEFTVDHSGVHYKGTRRGEPWSFDLPYTLVYSLPIMTDTSKFGYYVNGEYYEFYPDIPCTGKVLLLTEEMHRLHVNTWKNFSWFDYAYPEKAEQAPTVV